VNSAVLEVAHFSQDVLGVSAAVGHVVVELGPDMVDVVVDHGEGDANGQDGDEAECQCREGDEFVGLGPCRVHVSHDRAKRERKRERERKG
jgi:hypothetical protein